MSENYIPIPARLKNVSIGGHVAGAEDIDAGNSKNQQDVNAETAQELSQHSTQIADLQAMEQIVIDGGEAQIAQGSDFDNPTSAQRAKVTTVGAVLDGCDAEPTAGSVKPVQSGGVAEVTSIYKELALSTTKVNVINGTTGKWESFYATRYGIMMPIAQGKSYKFVTGNNRVSIAILKDNVTTSGESPNYSSAYPTYIVVSENTEFSFATPVDANYIWLDRQVNGVTRIYSFYEAVPLKEEVQIIKNTVDNIAASENIIVLPEWALGNSYVLGNQVQHTEGGITKYYRCKADTDSAVLTNTTYWGEMQFYFGGESIQSINVGDNSYPIYQSCIELKAWGTSIIGSLGDGEIGYVTSGHYLMINVNGGSYFPYIDGAIYTYNNELYIWNGSELVNVAKNLTTGIPVSDFTILPHSIIYSDGKIYSVDNDNAVFICNVQGIENLAFLGYRSSGVSALACYGFSSYETIPDSGVVVNMDLHNYGGGASQNRAEQYFVSVPNGAKWFVCTIVASATINVMTVEDFYCLADVKAVLLDTVVNNLKNRLLKVEPTVSELQDNVEDLNDRVSVVESSVGTIEEVQVPKIEGLLSQSSAATNRQSCGTWYNNRYVNTSGCIVASTGTTGNGVMIVNVTKAKKVRFLGYKRASSASSLCYGFSNLENINVNLPDLVQVNRGLTPYDGSAPSTVAKEYVVDVPSNVKWFICSIVKGSGIGVMTIDDFYCYLTFEPYLERQLSSFKNQNIRIFGGSVSMLSSFYARTYLVENELGCFVTNSGQNGAGFANQTTIIDGVPSFGQPSIPYQVNAATQEGMRKYDIYILWASTNDLTNNIALGEETDYTVWDNYDVSKLVTQCGGMNYCIKKIQDFAPTSQIVIIGSMKRLYGEDGITEEERTEYSRFYDLVEKQRLVAKINSIPYFSLWDNSSFNEHDRSTYFYHDTDDPYYGVYLPGSVPMIDGLHPNAKGYDRLVPKIAKFIKSFLNANIGT